MQTNPSNRLVEKKIQESVSLPQSVRDLMEPLIQRYGGRGRRKKHVVYIAAMLALAEMRPGEVIERIGEVGAAESTGEYGALVRRTEGRAKGVDLVGTLGSTAPIPPTEQGGTSGGEEEKKKPPKRRSSKGRRGRRGEPNHSQG